MPSLMILKLNDYYAKSQDFSDMIPSLCASYASSDDIPMCAFIADPSRARICTSVGNAHPSVSDIAVTNPLIGPRGEFSILA